MSCALTSGEAIQAARALWCARLSVQSVFVSVWFCLSLFLVCVWRVKGESFRPLSFISFNRCCTFVLGADTTVDGAGTMSG